VRTDLHIALLAMQDPVARAAEMLCLCICDLVHGKDRCCLLVHGETDVVCCAEAGVKRGRSEAVEEQSPAKKKQASDAQPKGSTCNVEAKEASHLAPEKAQ